MRSSPPPWPTATSGGPGLSDAEHPGDGPGAAPGAGDSRSGQPPGGGRGAGAGLGLFGLLRRTLPDLPLHASTQMSLFTSGGAWEIAADGCERVVLARSCPGRWTRGHLPAARRRWEVFAHGALCMCYSGQCEHERPDRRPQRQPGTCAQPCRLPYGVNAPAKRPSPEPEGQPTSAGLEEMGAMGVSCVKLEGRMKRPEYVAVITRIYARLLEEGLPPTADEQAELEQAFSRSGFTDWYWQGNTALPCSGTRRESLTPRTCLRRPGPMNDSLRRTVPVDLSCVCRGVPCTLTVRTGTPQRHGHRPGAEAARPGPWMDWSWKPASARPAAPPTAATPWSPW